MKIKYTAKQQNGTGWWIIHRAVMTKRTRHTDMYAGGSGDEQFTEKEPLAAKFADESIAKREMQSRGFVS